MHADRLTAIRRIQDLLADSRKEYEAAAHRVHDERTKSLLQRIGSSRAALEGEFADDMQRLDPGAQAGDGTVGGTLHRVLLGARDAVNSTSDVNVLVECERLDADLLSQYDEVLSDHGPDGVGHMRFVEHCALITMDLEDIKQLRRQLESIEH